MLWTRSGRALPFSQLSHTASTLTITRAIRESGNSGRSRFPRTPLSPPAKGSTDRLRSVQHSYTRGGTAKQFRHLLAFTAPATELSTTLASAIESPTHAIIPESSAVKSTCCHAANYSLLQRAGATRTGWGPFLPPQPPLPGFLLSLVQFSNSHAQSKRLTGVPHVFR